MEPVGTNLKRSSIGSQAGLSTMKACVSAGEVTIWLSDEVQAAWSAEHRKTRGGQPVCSDLAITSCLTPGMFYRQPLRQTEEFVRSLLQTEHYVLIQNLSLKISSVDFLVFRLIAFACAHLCSIGLGSGEYGGRYSRVWPAFEMSSLVSLRL